MKINKIIKLHLVFIFFVLWFFFALLYKYYLGPDQFHGMKDPIDPFYFGMSTMTTATYGDIIPLTTRAKIVVMFNQCISFVIMSCLVIF